MRRKATSTDATARDDANKPTDVAADNKIPTMKKIPLPRRLAVAAVGHIDLPVVGFVVPRVKVPANFVLITFALIKTPGGMARTI